MAYYVNNANSYNHNLTVGNVVLGQSSTATTYTLGAAIGGGSYNGTYTLAGTNTATTAVHINDTGIKMAAGTDLIIGGKGIKQMLEAIESRLAILEPNMKLESEWEELKRLGDEYRALEKEIQEKMKTWDILKKDN